MAMLRAFDGRVIFDHLERTGGQAVNAWLTNMLGSACVTHNLAGVGHRELIRRYGGEFSIISGHMRFEGRGLDPRYRYVTCVRDPVDRAISWIFFITKNHTEDQLGLLWQQAQQFLATDGAGLDLESEFTRSVQNAYVNHFAGILLDQQRAPDDEKMSAALAAIEMFDVLGLYEKFSVFLTDFAELIGVPPQLQIERRNASVDRPNLQDVSPRLRSPLEDMNALDIEFYRRLEVVRGKRRHNFSVPETPPAAAWVRYDLAPERRFCLPEFGLISAVLLGSNSVLPGDPLQFSVEFSLAREVSDLNIGIHIMDADGRWTFGTNTKLLKRQLSGIQPGIHRVDYCLVADLPEGRYTVGFAFIDHDDGGGCELAWLDNVTAFTVKMPSSRASIGYSFLPATIQFDNWKNRSC